MALGFGLLFDAPDAMAAIGIVNESSLPRLDASGNPVMKRRHGFHPEAINRRDCDDDQKIRFTLVLDGFEANGALQVWVAPWGFDCSAAGARMATSPTCWQVAAGLPLTPAIEVDVPVRDLIGGLSPFTPASLATGDDACGKVDLTRFAVQFLYFAPDDPVTPAWTRSVDLTVDTVGPGRPSEPNLASGTNGPSMFVSWNDESDPSTIASLIYCAPVDSDAAACALPENLQTATPAMDDPLACARVIGRMGVAVESDTQGPLESNRRYAFARSAVDLFENYSPLSPPACSTVTPARFEPSGGGCSSAATGTASAGAPGVLFAAALLLASRRRRK